MTLKALYDYIMHTTEPFVDVAPRPDFHWPPEEPAGHLAGLEPWPLPLRNPLKGVRVNNKYLCFEYRKAEDRGPLEETTGDFAMLVDFANLADRATGDREGALLAFASRFGALGLCKRHGWPFAHTRPHLRKRQRTDP